MNRLPASLLAAAVISILACADADDPADDDLAIQRTDVADVRAGEVAATGADAATAADAAGFCAAWDELSRADDPPSPEQLQAVRDNAPESLRDATAMYVEVVRSHGSARGVVSAMDFDQEMQLFSIVDWYTQNCIGD